MAALSSTIPNFYINLLKSLSNNIILALDNDEAGITATNKYMRYNNFQTILHTKEVKDIGTITDLETYKPNDQNLDYIRSYYRSQIVI